MVIDFIPLNIYGAIFHYVIFLLMARAIFQSATGQVYHLNRSHGNQWLGKLLVLWMILYMGLRPIDGFYFGDTLNYARGFAQMVASHDVDWLSQLLSFKGDFIFGVIMAWCAEYANIHIMFLICALGYVGGSALFCRRIFGNQWVTPFIVVCAMFEYWAYGINGVRNGMAASLVILALSYIDKWKIALLLALIGIGIHKSLLLVVAAALLARFIKNTKLYIAGWLGCIALSLTFGQRLSDAIANNELIKDERLEAYVSYAHDQKMMEGFSDTGFRWDFLLYSALPIVCGYFFIYKKNFRDPFFRWILNIYICANSFWVLMMYAFSSNRFAQLSWFLMGLVLIYPFFKKRFWKDQEQKLAWFLMLIYAYTFYRNIVLSFFYSTHL